MFATSLRHSDKIIRHTAWRFPSPTAATPFSTCLGSLKNWLINVPIHAFFWPIPFPRFCRYLPHVGLKSLQHQQFALQQLLLRLARHFSQTANHCPTYNSPAAQESALTVLSLPEGLQTESLSYYLLILWASASGICLCVSPSSSCASSALRRLTSTKTDPHGATCRCGHEKSNLGTHLLL